MGEAKTKEKKMKKSRTEGRINSSKTKTQSTRCSRLSAAQVAAENHATCSSWQRSQRQQDGDREQSGVPAGALEAGVNTPNMHWGAGRGSGCSHPSAMGTLEIINCG